MRSTASWLHHHEEQLASNNHQQLVGLQVSGAPLVSELLLLCCVLSVCIFLGAQVSALVSRCFRALSFDLEDVKGRLLLTNSDQSLLQSSSTTSKHDGVVFRYQELQKATQGFDKKCLIGEGGFAKVYKAVLPDSTVVAVKRLEGRGHASDREFKAELDTLAKSRHPNLVTFLGYCRTRQCNLLVYEYFENGSLDKILRDRSGSRDVHLDWPARLKIAHGAAQGLAYLHSQQPRIIHRDIKTSNILLSDKLEARVCDFGLARFIDASKSHLTTHLAGTRAHIAPEYQSDLRLTVKCDVYSFGIVLLQLLTGKDPSRRKFDLISWVKARQAKGQELEVFDPRIRSSRHKESMVRVLKIALQCIETAPNRRPTMDEVVENLSNLYNCTTGSSSSSSLRDKRSRAASSSDLVADEESQIEEEDDEMQIQSF
jgi:serine/threonine protein kinase